MSAFRDGTVSAWIGSYLLASSLVACGWLPTAGPSASEVVSQAVEDGRTRFEVVDVNEQVVDTLAGQPAESFHSRFSGSGLPLEQRISIGDSIGLQIWQAVDGDISVQSSGTHAAGGTQSEIIQPQLVMREGTIAVPYAGHIRVVGHSTAEVAKAIESRLEEQLIKPQVIVSVEKSDANTVAVSGEVVNGARVPLSPRGNRLLEVITAAGGVRAPLYEVFVRLSRGPVTATIPYDVLVANPAENIYAHPGDVVTLIRVPQTFDAFGATGRDQEYHFEADSITLAQALAKTGGLEDSRADPGGVFILRSEPSSLVQRLVAQPAAPANDTGLIPVVYRLDLSNAQSYLLAQRFAMKDKDAIYVADAKLTGLHKVFDLLSTISNPIVTGIVVTKP